MNKTEPILNVSNRENEFYAEWIDIVDEALYRRLGKVSTAFENSYDFNGMFISGCAAESCIDHIIERELMGHD